MVSLDDTIVAIASAPGGAARGIVRLSGPAAIEIVARCFQPTDHEFKFSDIQSACSAAGQFVTAENKLPVDLHLWPTARSFTRQAQAEIHTLGSPPLLELIVQALCAEGARLAQPGEFTLRAFLAGRIDLMQAEAVLGVIDATDRRQLDTALSQLAGGLSRPLQGLRDDLLNLLADLEAGLDFVEDDIRFIAPDELARRLADAARQLDHLSHQLTARGIGNRLPRVALVGLPNVGKSSLFNALKGQSAALVSATAGTTRDYLTVQIDAAGLPVELVDTAGLPTDIEVQAAECPPRLSVAAVGKIESMAHSTSIQQHQQADLRLLCVDSTRAMTAWEAQTTSGPNTLVVLTKCDRSQHSAMHRHAAAIGTSSRSGAGLERLRDEIRQAIVSQLSDAPAVAATSIRVHESLTLGHSSILRAIQLATDQRGEELVAAEVRAALTELGKIVGAIYTDDLLDRVFSRFCIGK